jgi:hypothetical protein
MIMAQQALRLAERSQTFRARHAAYCMPVGRKAPLMICGADAPGKPHDEFDKSPETLLYYVRDGRTVVGSARLIGHHPGLGLPFERLLAGRSLGLDLSQAMEASRLSLIPAYQDKNARRSAIMALFSAMLADSMKMQCTVWVAMLRSNVVVLLSAMKIAVTLVDEEPIRFEPGVTADGPLSGEPLFPVTIDLLESAAWLFADNTIGYQAIYKTDHPPVMYAARQIQDVRIRARSNLSIVARRMQEWKAFVRSREDHREPASDACVTSLPERTLPTSARRGRPSLGSPA